MSRRSYRPAHTAYHIENSNPPAEELRLRLVPFRLCLDHVQPTRNDEEDTAHEVRHPVNAVDHTNREMIIHAYRKLRLALVSVDTGRSPTKHV